MEILPHATPPRYNGRMRELSELPTPCYLFDETALENNMARVRRLREQTGCRVLLALKGFAAWRLFSFLRPALDGVAASSLNESRLGAEEFGGEVHAYSPAYRPDEFGAILQYASHLVFNSETELARFGGAAAAKKKPCGIRINPDYSEIANPLYNPCRPHSHLGVRLADAGFIAKNKNIAGLHFHALCEQNSDSLARVAEKVDEQFGDVLPRMRWLNFGGGHMLGEENYGAETLAATAESFRRRYGLTVYLEPGGGLVHECCELIAAVLDVQPGGCAVLDCSASAHMPDVLETPYQPQIAGASAAGELPHTYRLCGQTCMAGDIFGEYSFARRLSPGDIVRLQDAAAYTLVKSTVFNGIAPPSIALRHKDGEIEILRRPEYEDYRRRMA